MDFSDLINQSNQADLNYAQWYSQLSDERKAQFFLDGYNFVVEKIRYDVLKENPFACEAEIIWRFIELTQKDQYDDKTFAFIKKQMETKINHQKPKLK